MAGNGATVWWSARQDGCVAVWLCTVPGDHAESEDVSGLAGSISEACDAARAHLRSCSLALAALDRLLADVMTLPEYRRMWLPDPAGRIVEVVACIDCGHVIADEIEHTVTHIEANDFAQGVLRHADADS